MIHYIATWLLIVVSDILNIDYVEIEMDVMLIVMVEDFWMRWHQKEEILVDHTVIQFDI